MKRREFCVHACRVVSAATLGSLAACGGSTTSPSSAPALPTISASIVNGSISIAVDANSPLASVGGAALVSASGANFLVARTGQASVTALTAVCTHEGCTVSGFQNQTYVCPCHGSEYTTTGSVVQGPAAAPLRQFPASLANNVVTISVG